MTGYNDPKVTKPTTAPGANKPVASGSSKTIWYIVAAVVVLLALAWMFGMFSGAETVTTEPGATDAPAATTTTTPEPATPAAPAPANP